jgi:23S rRNA (pseudouridine1915-N3)-methyltransferase
MSARPQITVLCVGKLRETFWGEAQAEYVKRLQSYTSKISVVEVPDEAVPAHASPADEEIARQKEGERMLAKIGERAFVVALDGSRGKVMGSEAFAHYMERAASDDGASQWLFLIGGSHGLHEAVLLRADLVLSFGAFTFPHQLMRIVLLEQLYRAAKIVRGETYHK